MSQLILATSSPYRQGAFRFLGLDFIAHGSNVDERSGDRPQDPHTLVLYLAELKAKAVARKFRSGIVLGFDSVGVFGTQILEKPRSREEAHMRLKALSGKRHHFSTGIFMLNIGTGQQMSRVVSTEIQLRNLTDSEISKYLDQDPQFNTYALGYDPLGHYSSTFATAVNGSYNNFLHGIPLEAVIEMLPKVGYGTPNGNRPPGKAQPK